MKPTFALRRLAAPVLGAPQVVIDDATIEHVSQTFKLLADNSRLKILLALSRLGEMHVTALCRLLQQSQPAVSHHLMLLRMASLVQVRRAGRRNYYSLDARHASDLLAVLGGENPGPDDTNGPANVDSTEPALVAQV